MSSLSIYLWTSNFDDFRLKGTIYRMVVTPASLYGAKCWPIKMCHIQRMRAVEMRMTRWMCGHSRFDKIRNEVIRGKIEVKSIEHKIREATLRWFSHMRRSMDAPLRRCENVNHLDHRRSRDRLKKRWSEVTKYDFKTFGTCGGHSSG